MTMRLCGAVDFSIIIKTKLGILEIGNWESGECRSSSSSFSFFFNINYILYIILYYINYNYKGKDKDKDTTNPTKNKNKNKDPTPTPTPTKATRPLGRLRWRLWRLGAWSSKIHAQGRRSNGRA